MTEVSISYTKAPHTSEPKGPASEDTSLEDIDTFVFEGSASNGRVPAHTPEWHSPAAGDPGPSGPTASDTAPATQDPEWRYVSVRRFSEDDQDETYYNIELTNGTVADLRTEQMNAAEDKMAESAILDFALTGDAEF